MKIITAVFIILMIGIVLLIIDDKKETNMRQVKCLKLNGIFIKPYKSKGFCIKKEAHINVSTQNE